MKRNVSILLVVLFLGVQTSFTTGRGGAGSTPISDHLMAHTHGFAGRGPVSGTSNIQAQNLNDYLGSLDKNTTTATAGTTSGRNVAPDTGEDFMASSKQSYYKVGSHYMGAVPEVTTEPVNQKTVSTPAGNKLGRRINTLPPSAAENMLSRIRHGLYRLRTEDYKTFREYFETEE